ncbi:hypothetical protein [Burkholderia pseudomultivorans]|uniref:hypothetical protein n=1 Tax=Burkholderia pseudomultivorans TaxID=1207504 RepID=UPI0012D88CF7|nr:hypothetical protein [Burkholderia pseudomultivorans]
MSETARLARATRGTGRFFYAYRRREPFRVLSGMNAKSRKEKYSHRDRSDFLRLIAMQFAARRNNREYGKSIVRHGSGFIHEHLV